MSIEEFKRTISSGPRRAAPLASPRLRLSILAAAVAAAGASHAQDDSEDDAARRSGIEEFVVTQVRSRNRLEDQQDVPISISVVRGEELDRLLANDINSLVLRTANISWNQGNQRTSSISIRGIGKVGQTEAQDPSVGVIVDGISYAYNALTSSFDFYDLDTVEVVRGPQGTLLGKNASVGVINVTTKRPSFDSDADFQLTLGERDTVIARAALGGPVFGDVLAWRGAFTLQKAEGYQANRFNPDISWQSKDRVSGRIQLLYEPTENFSARLQAVKTPRTGETTNGRGVNTPRPATYLNGVPNNSLDNVQRLSRPYFTQRSDYTIDGDFLYGGSGDPDNPGTDLNADTIRPVVTGSNGGILELNWDRVGPFSLTSITGYQDYYFNAFNDEGTPWAIQYASGFWNNYRQASQEFRLSSDVGSVVDYQVGLYALRVHNVAKHNQHFGPDAGAWFASNAQYARLDVPVNPDGSVSGGPSLLRNSASGLRVATNASGGDQDILNKSYAAFGQANWRLNDRLTLTTGVRLTQENRRNTTEAYIVYQGDGSELNPVASKGVSLGGFASNASGALLAGNTVEQLNVADRTALKYFGVATTDVPGAAYDSLTSAQKRQVADAKAIREARIGVVHPRGEAEPFEDTQPAFVLSPVFRLNDNVNLYFAWQYGEKAGIAQTRSGESYLVEGEENNAYEIGVKSVLLDNRLWINADYYTTTITNYQQGVRLVDELQTALNIEAGIEPATAYLSVTGNVPKVKAKGIEVDGLYSGIPNTRLRFAFAYTDAYYAEFPNSGVPTELGWPGQEPYIDISGYTLPGISKYSANLGLEWSKPVGQGNEFFVNANASYQHKFNNDDAGSIYGWLPSRTIVDASFGYGLGSRGFQISLVGRNLFDQDSPLSAGVSSYLPPEPRWLGVMVTGSL